MTKIICARVECKYNNNFLCKAKEINLSDHSIMTMYEGRQDFLQCKTFELSDIAKAIEENLKNFSLGE